VRGRRRLGREGKKGERGKEEKEGRGCGPAVGPHPNKPLVTWHLCHVTKRVTWHMLLSV
jgi:hypothetical protein